KCLYLAESCGSCKASADLMKEAHTDESQRHGGDKPPLWEIDVSKDNLLQDAWRSADLSLVGV
ncbi:hypothetical protein MPER_00036, partial [Moniliophthora perniciosa FA553]